MFGTSVGILYLGHKKGTPNVILWALFILTRGLNWFIEFLADYYEEIYDIEIIILDHLEIFMAFCSSFILLAACLEHNGMIKRHLGKIIVLLLSILPLCLILMIDHNTLEEFEDIPILRGDIISTELARFLYGFILPLLSIVAIIGTYFYYYYETNKGKIFYNPKLLKVSLILVILIFIFSLFDGFDYYEEEEEIEIFFIGLRAITLSFFIIVPLIIVFTYDLGLQKFLIIEHSGIPLFAYSFETKSATSDEISFLTSGFLSAILGFSEELSKKEADFLSIQSHYLYYVIAKTETKIYALQSISKNKYLENQFFHVAKEIENRIAEISKFSESDITQVKEILDKNFSAFL